MFNESHLGIPAERSIAWNESRSPACTEEPTGSSLGELERANRALGINMTGRRVSSSLGNITRCTIEK